MPPIPPGCSPEIKPENISKLNFTMTKASIIHGDFTKPDTVELVKKALSEKPESTVRTFIADALFGIGKEAWDQKEDKWEYQNFLEIFKFAG